MDSDKAARFLGAGLAAAAVTTLVLTDWYQCGGNGLRGWIQFFLPVVIPIIFTLPNPSISAYFRNGLPVVLGIAVVAGFYGSVAHPPGSCELLYAGATGYFAFWGFFSAVIMAVGSVPFGVLLFILRRLAILRPDASAT